MSPIGTDILSYTEVTQVQIGNTFKLGSMVFVCSDTKNQTFFLSSPKILSTNTKIYRQIKNQNSVSGEQTSASEDDKYHFFLFFSMTDQKPFQW